MTTTVDLRVIHLHGSPRERGRIHGEQLRQQIHTCVGRWKESLGSATGLVPDQYLAGLLAATSFPEAIRHWTPELLDEVHGIAEGAALDFETVFAYQLLDEEWWYKRYLSPKPSSSVQEHCSGVAVFGRPGLPTILAQNMDVNSYYDGGQALLHIQFPESNLEALIFTAAGLIALNGLNNHQMGVCVNTLMQLDHAADGLPVAFVIRGLLEKESIDEAVQFLQRIKHASGQNYIIAGPAHAVDFECSANKVVRFEPSNGGESLYHTNHPLVNSDQGMFDQLQSNLTEEEQQQIQRHRSNSARRFQYLESSIDSQQQSAGIEEIRRLLSETEEAPVCVTRQAPGWLTLGCTIMELSEPPKLHIAPGPPDETPFRTYQF